MNALPAGQTAALPKGRLLWLTLLVLLAHALLLQSVPSQWNAPLSSRAASQRPFVTRTIEIKPPAAASAPTPVAALPRVSRSSARVLAPKTPGKKRVTPTQSTPPPSPGPAVAEVIDAPVTEPDSNNAAPAAVQEPDPINTATAQNAKPSQVEPDAEISTLAAEPPEDKTQITPGPRVPLAIPGSVVLKYDMTGYSKGRRYAAWAELEWLQDGDNYDAKMEVSALFLGSRAMTSAGRITADGLTPTRFSDKSRSERAAHFQADKGKITFSANSPDLLWQRGAQDRVSVFVQLASLLAGDPARYPLGSSIALYTVGPRDADIWTFVVEAEETLTLAYGEIKALKLIRKPQGNYDRTVEIWFAPSLNYLPVRSRISQRDGDFIDQQLRDVQTP
jgi:hypothetical protein